MKENGFFIAIGNNSIRKNIYHQLESFQMFPANAIHSSSIVDASVKLASHGIMLAAGAVLCWPQVLSLIHWQTLASA